MAKVGRTLTIQGVRYRVLCLSTDPRARGPAFLLRSERGEVFGLFRANATPMKLQAFALRSEAKAIAFQELEFFDADGELTVAKRAR